MTKTLLMGAILVLAACGGKQGGAPAADTSAAAPAGAPMTPDTTTPMMPDTAAHSDTMARDSMPH